ncbi:MAG: hypothetical protein STHCBS139747_000722 [Sporothrix thermara]
MYENDDEDDDNGDRDGGNYEEDTGEKDFAWNVASAASRSTARHDALLSAVRRVGLYVVAAFVLLPPALVILLAGILGVAYVLVLRVRPQLLPSALRDF